MGELVASSVGIAAGVFAFVAAAGISGSRLAAVPVATMTAGLVGWLIHRRSLVPLDESACTRGLKVVSGMATLVALLQLIRLAVFIVDPSEVAYSVVPTSTWEAQHSCLSAYFVSAEAASAAHDVYDDTLFTMTNDDPTKIRRPRLIGPFKIDVFEYPPPFLLLPRALRLLTPDFIHLRMLWFGLSGVVLLVAFLVVARFLGPAAGTRALLLSPVIWSSISTISTLQKGNAQGMVIAASMLAMVLFERRRWAAGGALLAFVTMSKLYPGMLLVYLLARREWRALGWTGAMGVALLVISVVDTGLAPYGSFLQHLPGIVGGEAFPAFRNPAAMAINLSVPGIVFKLKLFDVPGMGFGASKIVGWIYTLAVVAATVVAARRAVEEHQRPLIWLAILGLATLRSPFLPQAYGVFPALWLLTLVAALGAPTTKSIAALILGWAALSIYWPLDWPLDPRLLAVASTVSQATIVVLAVLLLRRQSVRAIPSASRSAQSSSSSRPRFQG